VDVLYGLYAALYGLFQDAIPPRPPRGATVGNILPRGNTEGILIVAGQVCRHSAAAMPDPKVPESADGGGGTRPSFQWPRLQDAFEVAGRVEDANDLDAVVHRPVEDQVLLEMLDPPDA
jgi:hypothetical protein